jgi:ComEC/Rec2-related protein
MIRRWKKWQEAAGAAIHRWGCQMHEPLFLLACGAIAGILLADHWPQFPWWAVAGIAVPAGFCLWKRGWSFLAVTVGFALLHGVNMQDPLRKEAQRVIAPGGALQARVIGVLTDAPVKSAYGDSWQFPLRVESLQVGQTLWPGAGSLLYVRFTDSTAPPGYGGRVSLQGLLKRPSPVRNPGEFDFDLFLKRQGIAAEFAAEGSGERWQLLATGLGNPVMAAALQARDWIAGMVTLDLENSPDIAATVRCMVLGTQEKTPDEITDAFRASGTMHVFSVSGLHVALFAAVLWFILSRTPLPRGWIIGLSLSVMVFYVFITGLRPSAWRAALMVGMFMLAPLWNRESNLFNSLAAAALLLLGWQTWQLFQAGFVLSFGVLLAIALFQQPCSALASLFLGRWNAPDPFLPEELRTPRQSVWYWMREKLCLSLGVSTASTLGSMPLMIGYFNLVTPVGILANLLLVTLSLWILVVACLSLLSAGLGLKPLVLLWNNANWALAWASIAIAKFFASLPLGHVRIDPARLWRGTPCEVTVLALDHGGGAARIDTPAGLQWMIDCGGLKHWNRTMRPHLERAPVNQLQGLFLTHADSYHMGAMPRLRELFPPRALWLASGKNGPVPGTLTAGQSFPLEDGVRLEVLFPPESWQAGTADDRATVLRLDYQGFRLLFMSDAGFLTEKALLASGMDLRADVLVMGRHGSDFCGLPEFIRAVHPGALVCSNSRFPESERAPASWRERVQRMGITLFDQATTGAVTLRMDQRGLSAHAYSNALTWSTPLRPLPPWSAPPEKPGPLIR